MRLRRYLLYIRFNAEYNINMEKIKFEKIWQYIEENNYTLKKFRMYVGISKRELNKILAGDLDFKFVSLIKLAKFLDIPVSWLLDSGETEVQTKFYL